MICDQCGCEHNSKSVCPKCGARVVYVNEDYERRKREYLEAQQKGEKAGTKTESGAVIPSGIMYSTEDEHNLRKGRDKATEHYRPITPKEEDDTELKGFLKFLEKALVGLATVLVFFRKKFKKLKASLKKKRGRNNPVLNGLNFDRQKELEFDDGRETLDTSKLVLAHKVFKDRRVPIFVGCGIGAVLIIGLIVFLVIYNTTDWTRVIGLVGDGENHSILSVDAGQLRTYLTIEDSTILAYTEKGTPALAVAEDSVILIEKDGIRHLETDASADYTQAVLSEDGSSYALVGCIAEEVQLDSDKVDGNEAADGQGSDTASDSEETYLLYVGDETGSLTQAVNGKESLIILNVSEEGTVTYLAMETGAYNVIGSKRIVRYDPDTGRNTTLAEDFTDYEYDAASDILYYISEEKLYAEDCGKMTVSLLDDSVLALATDGMDTYDGVLYEKEKAYYHWNPNKEEAEVIVRSSTMGLEFYYMPQAHLQYIYQAKSGGGLLYEQTDYAGCLDSEAASGTATADDGQAGAYSGNTTADDDQAGAYTGTATVAMNVTTVLVMEDGQGLAWQSATEVHILRTNQKEVILYPEGMARDLKAVAYSSGKYYFLWEDDCLQCLDSAGNLSGSQNDVADIWIVAR